MIESKHVVAWRLVERRQLLCVFFVPMGWGGVGWGNNVLFF